MVFVAGDRCGFGGPCGGIVRHGGDGMRDSVGKGCGMRACMLVCMDGDVMLWCVCAYMHSLDVTQC